MAASSFLESAVWRGERASWMGAASRLVKTSALAGMGEGWSRRERKGATRARVSSTEEQPVTPGMTGTATGAERRAEGVRGATTSGASTAARKSGATEKEEVGLEGPRRWTLASWTVWWTRVPSTRWTSRREETPWGETEPEKAVRLHGVGGDGEEFGEGGVEEGGGEDGEVGDR